MGVNAIKYVVVEHAGSARIVTEHASKSAAHAYGMGLRRAGSTAFAYPVAEARRLGIIRQADPTPLCPCGMCADGAVTCTGCE